MVAEDEALRLLSRGRWRRLRSGRHLALELLYLPHWLVVYETLDAAADPHAAGDWPSSGEQLAVLVCRLSGQAAHIRLDGLEVAPGPPTLPPALQPAEAEERAADFAGRVLLMAARGKRRRERGRLPRSEPCGYPYWVEYLERGRNVDFRALDAVSGKRAGAAVRSAIAQGIAAGSWPGARLRPSQTRRPEWLTLSRRRQ
ncbi:MAG: hypothetical protein OXU63_15295 [Acidobacteriota bacterium]|nr:hypothetical protein [Acidobacteriota bacterium]